ncbi:helix-turn-helix domain-containing protein [[Clostridium] hylemonae]|uniref:helix-turn-helix domain-containing protein n=1 Tax=[Clostridium] hylemonae TaxID=89153 RepID=UPI001FCC4F33|nr:helix-turn-helix transcriptional regulator [[Clostridium] hylemonae]BDF03010.1 hypothetical protein CE91St63_00720 [[Clostridium] hylemonae]
MAIDENVGKNIKKYRLAYKLTLEELAKKIHKSKSTMSKYEKGLISLDVATLEEIADVFQISPAYLLAVQDEELHSRLEPGEFLDRQYMYSYDGRSRHILKSVMERYQIPGSEQIGIQLFYDVQDEESCGNCKTFYTGYSRRYEFVENYNLQNQNNPTEQAWICCINSLNRTSRRTGMLTGLSYKTMMPVAIKVMLSAAILKEDDGLIASLLLTREDIRISRKYNLFTIDQFME